MNISPQYAHMCDTGASPGDVYLAAKADGLEEITCIRLLRDLFRLSLVEAKAVVITTDQSISSLEEHQERLTPVIEAAIKRLQSEEAGEESS